MMLRILPQAAIALAASFFVLDSASAADACLTTEQEGSAFMARVSPQGDRVCYTLANEEGMAIWVSDLDGANARQVTPPKLGALYPKWSRDGTRIGFRTYSMASNNVWQVEIDGGEPTIVSDGSASASYDWSPDGERMVWSSFRGEAQNLWISNIDGTMPRQITYARQESTNAQWSPSGEWIAYRGYDKDNLAIWVVKPEGGDTERLLTKSGLRYEIPSWSPDGTLLLAAACEGRNAPMGIWLVDLEGKEKRLMADADQHTNPIWAPDGESVYFQSNRGGQPGVWQLQLDTLELRRVFSDGNRFDDYSVGAGGSAILYQRGSYKGGQYFYDLDTGERTPIALGGGVSVSTDGQWAAYQSYQTGNQDIWIRNLVDETATPRQLTHYSGADSEPSWSPDGKQVAYVSDHVSKDIWLASTEEGGAEPRMLAGSDRDETDPSWSPDGRFVAFISDRDSVAPNLWFYRVSDGQLTRVTDGTWTWKYSWSKDGESLIYTSYSEELGKPYLSRYWLKTGERDVVTSDAYDFRGVFSPDGSKYVFERLADAVDLYLTDFKKGTTERLTDAYGYEGDPLWSGDGRYLFYSANQGLVRMDIESRELVQVFGNDMNRSALWVNLDGSRILCSEGKYTGELYVNHVPSLWDSSVTNTSSVKRNQN